MVRLTAELLARAEERLNFLGNRELNLRSLGIQTIENLGAANDQFQTIDFTQNEIKELGGFPLMRRIRELLLSNNSIDCIASNFPRSLPFLTTLVLTNNNLAALSDLDVLKHFVHLETLVLIGNPVTFKPDYRQYCIRLIPSLQVLDFARVKLKERRDAKVGSAVATTAAATPTTTTVVSSQTRQEAIERAVLNAKTVEEVERLENLLSLGIIPGENEDSSVRKRTKLDAV